VRRRPTPLKHLVHGITVFIASDLRLVSLRIDEFMPLFEFYLSAQILSVRLGEMTRLPTRTVSSWYAAQESELCSGESNEILLVQHMSTLYSPTLDLAPLSMDTNPLLRITVSYVGVCPTTSAAHLLYHRHSRLAVALPPRTFDLDTLDRLSPLLTTPNHINKDGPSSSLRVYGFSSSDSCPA
jgi:hypothetical protein